MKPAGLFAALQLATGAAAIPQRKCYGVPNPGATRVLAADDYADISDAGFAVKAGKKPQNWWYVQVPKFRGSCLVPDNHGY
jgi:hypothetical protein